MHGLLEGLEDFLGTYIDAILIYSDSIDQHLWHIKEVLERLGRMASRLSHKNVSGVLGSKSTWDILLVMA